jgi:hypothetical protein
MKFKNIIQGNKIFCDLYRPKQKRHSIGLIAKLKEPGKMMKNRFRVCLCAGHNNSVTVY